jgi:hypothetical protein
MAQHFPMGLWENAGCKKGGMYDDKKKFYHFVYTFNNPQDHGWEADGEAGEAWLDFCNSSVTRLASFGFEVGANGTPHFQGFHSFKTQKTIKSAIKNLQKYMPGCHVEVCFNRDAAIKYTQKDGDFKVIGEPFKSKEENGADEQQRWKDLRKAAESGNFELIPEKIRFQQAKLLDYHRSQYLQKRKLEDSTEQHLWFWGPTRTGKSKRAREIAAEEGGGLYLKMCNKWWNGYTDEDIVLVEDFDACHSVLGYFVKIWGDRYPFNSESKGSASIIRPKKIIITSNWHPQEIWGEVPQTLDPILARFKCVEFKTFGAAAASEDLNLSPRRRVLARTDAFSVGMI